eukprot:c20444_g1_i4.p1 GENE.c20444_g1_i4~~c20444_g1_i4.p1  ORF type:complete len:335 (+),score=67.46 c20444_g1_i4:253-1257(+)
MYDTAAFLIFMRIGIPILNFVGAGVSAQATLIHVQRLLFKRSEFGSQRTKRTAWVMLLGSVIELCSCMIRAVYFAMGPILSTTRIYFQAHMVLVFVPMGTDLVATWIAVVLFLRWGAFGQVQGFLKQNLQLIVSIVALINFVTTLVLGVAQAYHLADLKIVITGASLITCLSLVVTSAVFLYTGRRFIHQLHQVVRTTTGRDTYRARCMKKAVMWIYRSGAFLVVQIIGTGLASSGAIFYRPQGNMLTFALMYYGMSCAGVSHALAFRPLGDQTTSKTELVASRAKVVIKFPRSLPRTIAKLRAETPVKIKTRRQSVQLTDTPSDPPEPSVVIP